MTDGRTHYDGCWQDHMDCARRKIEALEEQVATLMVQRDNATRRSEAADEVARRSQGRFRARWWKRDPAPPDVAARTCFDCAHFEFSLGEADWSDVTPGASSEMSCRRDYFDLDGGCSNAQYRDAINMALDCPSFEEAPR